MSNDPRTTLDAPRRRLHDVEGAAKLLECSNDTVRRLIARGDLRAVRVGRLLKIDDRAIEQFIARGGSPQD